MTATVRTPSPPAGPAPPAARYTDRAVWWRSFLLFSLMGAIWAVSIPMLAGPDEAQHASKAAGVAHGEFTWVDRYEVEGTGPDNPTRVETWMVMPRPYTELDYACIALPPLRPADCMSELPDDKSDETAYINSAASYPPAFYVATGWPSLFVRPSLALYGMRALHVLGSAALLASAMVAARRADRSGIALIGIAAAVTPMVTFLTATINPNGLEIAAAVAVWCTALEVMGRADRVGNRTVTRFVVAMSALVLMRPLSIAMLGVIVLVGLIATWRWARVRDLLAARNVQAGLAAFAGVVGFALFWLAYAEPQNTFWGSPADVTVSEAAAHSLGEFGFRTRQMIGVLGWVDAPATVPVWGIVGWLAVVAALVIGALVVGTMRQRLAVLAALALTVAVPVGSEALQASEVGYIWQGRYGLPIAVGVPIMAAWTLGRSGRLTLGARRRAGAVAVGLLAFLQVLAYVTLMRRYVIGEPSPLLAFLSEGTWQPDLLPKPVWLLLTTVTAAVTAGWYVVAGQTGDEADGVRSPTDEALLDHGRWHGRPGADTATLHQDGGELPHQAGQRAQPT